MTGHDSRDGPPPDQLSFPRSPGRAPDTWAVDAGLGDAAGRPAVPRSRRGMAAVALVAVLAATAAVMIWRSWDTARQPVTWGCCEEPPVGSGIRAVNTFAGYREDIYVLPQRGTFVLFATIRNGGSRPVRIGKVTLGQTYGMPRLAGPVRYARGFPARRLTAIRQLPALPNVTLAAGGGLFLAIALRTWPCASRGGWVIDPSFYLTERSLLFTRTVALPWTRNGGALIMRPSAGRRPGQAGSFCVARWSGEGSERRHGTPGQESGAADQHRAADVTTGPGDRAGRRPR